LTAVKQLSDHTILVSELLDLVLSLLLELHRFLGDWGSGRHFWLNNSGNWRLKVCVDRSDSHKKRFHHVYHGYRLVSSVTLADPGE
jgi:hypothetical protein